MSRTQEITRENHPLNDNIQLVTTYTREGHKTVEIKSVDHFKKEGIDVVLSHLYKMGAEWHEYRYKYTQVPLTAIDYICVYSWNDGYSSDDDILQKSFYEDGILKERRDYATGGVRSLSKIEQFNRLGTVISEQFYVRGDGQYLGFDIDGTICELGQFKAGMRHGKWFKKENNKVRVKNYRNGESEESIRMEGSLWLQCLKDFGVG